MTGVHAGRDGAGVLQHRAHLRGRDHRHHLHRGGHGVRARPVPVPSDAARWSALFLLATLVPGVTTQVATFQIINGLGLYGSRWALILLFMGTDIVSIYIFVQFMRSIPRSLDEAAMIEGAGHLRIFFQIILPNLKPAIATVVIIKGIGIYNEFFLPFLYLNDPDELSRSPRRCSRSRDRTARSGRSSAAGVVITIIPILRAVPVPAAVHLQRLHVGRDEVAPHLGDGGSWAGCPVVVRHTRVARTSAMRSGSCSGASSPTPDRSRPGSRTPSGVHHAGAWSTVSPGSLRAHVVERVGVEPRQRDARQRRARRASRHRHRVQGVAAVLRDHAVHRQDGVDDVGVHGRPGVQQRPHLLVEGDPRAEVGQLRLVGLLQVPLDPEVPEQRGRGPEGQRVATTGAVRRARSRRARR